MNTMLSLRSIKKKEEIIKRIENLYNSIIRGYIKKNNLRLRSASTGSPVYHLSESEYIVIVFWNDESISLDFCIKPEYAITYWLTLNFKDDKLRYIRYRNNTLPVEYADLLYAYERMKKLGIMVV